MAASETKKERLWVLLNNYDAWEQSDEGASGDTPKHINELLDEMQKLVGWSNKTCMTDDLLDRAHAIAWGIEPHEPQMKLIPWDKRKAPKKPMNGERRRSSK